MTVVVDPEVLYKGYRFRSGTSEAWRKHCAELAEQCGLPGRVLDIAANDGTCLRAFRERGWKTSGIDPAPATDDASLNITQGWWPDYDEYRGYDIIIAQNVLGHVNDPVTFLGAIARHLAGDGQAVIEVPNVGNLIDDCAFDTIYHEHLSYWNGIAMERACREAGLAVQNIQRLPDIHGGSVRYWLSPDETYKTVYDFTQDTPYVLFAQRVSRCINRVAGLLVNQRRSKIVAWGASAKGSVMLNAVANRWVSRWLPDYVIDETAEKQGLLMPGVGIPIIAPPEDLSDVDVIWCLIWNWLPSVREKARARGFKGQFLITSPRVGLVD